MRLDITYFAENTVTKYFLLLQITVHVFLSLGGSINSAMDQPKKNAIKENAAATTTQTEL